MKPGVHKMLQDFYHVFDPFVDTRPFCGHLVKNLKVPKQPQRG